LLRIALFFSMKRVPSRQYRLNSISGIPNLRYTVARSANSL
jgi:hypothetical protein